MSSIDALANAAAAADEDVDPTDNGLVTKRNVRGSTYSKHEDMQVCKAYIAASEDPIVGAGQKKSILNPKCTTSTSPCLLASQSLMICFSKIKGVAQLFMNDTNRLLPSVPNLPPSKVVFQSNLV